MRWPARSPDHRPSRARGPRAHARPAALQAHDREQALRHDLRGPVVRSADRGLQGVPVPKSGACDRRRSAAVPQGRLRSRRPAQRLLAATVTSSPPTPQRTSSRTRRRPASSSCGACRSRSGLGSARNTSSCTSSTSTTRSSERRVAYRHDVDVGDSGTGGAMSKARSGRFAGERSPAFVALNSSLSLDWRLWPEDIEGSAAHARALRRAGVLDAAELTAVDEGLAEIAVEIESGAFVPRDDDEDVHMAVERRLTELVRRAGSEAPHGAQPQRPGGDRRAASPAPRDRGPARRPARAAGARCSSGPRRTSRPSCRPTRTCSAPR